MTNEAGLSSEAEVEEVRRTLLLQVPVEWFFQLPPPEFEVAPPHVVYVNGETHQLLESNFHTDLLAMSADHSIRIAINSEIGDYQTYLKIREIHVRQGGRGEELDEFVRAFYLRLRNESMERSYTGGETIDGNREVKETHRDLPTQKRGLSMAAQLSIISAITLFLLWLLASK